MIPPAPVQSIWTTLATATLLPLTLLGLGIREQAVEARQSQSQGSSLPNGIYLYSDVPQPNQLQHEYVLFQHQNGKVVGAFYMPRSEFSCFAGEMRGNTLDVQATVIGEPQSIEADTALTGFDSIRTISANDQRILAACQQSEIARSVE
ncbi:hypothetical protein [Leptolyngbya sp. NIES-2104]|uniref:hypothetical protein n=1 Tax=Leptolyngbya sp. NIES-2104 TaxID=1552121 RepID=UPI0006EC572C|nr:hypothetical protein [Leptolyngbya sp. NIES-2104]GAP96939.1 hypothetical protein NIES2104_34860 [Leptolyngbya sp. NIES-2104]